MADYRKWGLALLIGLVDLSTAENVFETYSFFERPVFAFLVATAFAALQVGCLVLFSQDLQETTRRWLLAGVSVLFGVTALGNISMAFLRARPVLPADQLLPVLGFASSDGLALLVQGSWLFGLALPISGLIFWNAYGQWLRRERERQVAEREAQMRRMLEFDQDPL